MINRLFPTEEQKTEKKINKFMGLSLDDAIKRASRLKKVKLHEFSGWVDYVQILNDYIERVKERKAKLRMDVATEQELQVTKWLDHEAWFIESYVKPLLNSYIEGLEKKLEAARKQEDQHARG